MYDYYPQQNSNFERRIPLKVLRVVGAIRQKLSSLTPMKEKCSELMR